MEFLRFLKSLFATAFFLLAVTSGFTLAQDGQDSTAMTPERMGEMILRLDEDAQNAGNMWTFKIDERQVTLIYDVNADRMRIIIPVTQVAQVTQTELTRMMQANFDSALDARYALAQDIIWSAFIHPLSDLTDEGFLSGIGQTVNLAQTYGSTYTSGAFIFGGGDSQDIMRRELIDELIEKGTPI